MSCEGCDISPKGQNTDFEAAKTLALAFSQKNNVSVAIYKEGTEYHFMEAFAAYASGLGPAIQTTISKHQ